MVGLIVQAPSKKKKRIKFYEDCQLSGSYDYVIFRGPTRDEAKEKISRDETSLT